MTETTFKPGDVVRLNSGGPAMTVQSIQSDGGLFCVWFNSAKQDQGTFSAAMLGIYQKPRPHIGVI